MFYVLIFLFRSLSPDASRSYGSTSNAFIFSLRNKEGLGPFKSMVTRPSYAIRKRSFYGPTFGNGPDIYIANNANTTTNSYTNFGYSYSVPSGVQDKKTILAGTYKFIPEEVEVFYLGWIFFALILMTFFNSFIYPINVLSISFSLPSCLNLFSFFPHKFLFHDGYITWFFFFFLPGLFTLQVAVSRV